MRAVAACLAALLLAVPVTLFAFDAAPTGRSDDRSGRAPLVGSGLTPRVPRGVSSGLYEWTVLVYMAGDNDLAAAAEEDLAEIAAADLGSDVALAALVDLDGIHDTRLVVQLGNAQSERPISRLGYPEGTDELNTAEPDTLAAFGRWGRWALPARRYALILWDHGSGWNRLCQDGWDALTIDELAQALGLVASESPDPWDLLGFDCCLMDQLEVLTACRAYAEVMVASEMSEPVDGWPFDALLGGLAVDPAVGPADWAASIVAAYIDSYTDGLPDPTDEPGVTLAAVDVGLIDEMGLDAFDALAQAMRQACYPYAATQNNPLRTARAAAEGPSADDVDLRSLTDALIAQTYPAGPLAYLGDEIRARAEEFRSILDEAVLASGTAPDVAGLDSLSVSFPTDGPEPGYEETALALYGMWDEFLTEFANPQTVGLGLNAPPTAAVDDLLASGVFTASGTAADANLQDSVERVLVRYGRGPWMEASVTELGGTTYWRAPEGIDTGGMTELPVTAKAFDSKEWSREARLVLDVSNPIAQFRFTNQTFSGLLSGGGGRIRATATVVNAGSAPATAAVALYVDGVGENATRVAVPAGGNASVLLAAPSSLGPHAVALIVDPFDEVLEGDEADNAVTGTAAVEGHALLLGPPTRAYVPFAPLVRVPVTVRNGGTFPESIQMVAWAGNGWSATPAPTSLVLPPGGEERVLVELIRPSGAAMGDSFPTGLNATSANASASVSWTTEVVLHVSDAEEGAGGWSDASGLWHVTATDAAQGERSFWCADEAHGSYPDGMNATLLSPYLDLAGFVEAELRVLHRYEFEAGYDGGVIEVLSAGVWSRLVPDGGYPASYVDALDGPGFSGAAGWAELTASLNDYLGQTIRLRFRAASDGMYNAEGWFVDQIVVRGRRIDYDAALAEISVSGQAIPGATVTLRAHVENRGYMDLSSVPVDLWVTDPRGTQTSLGTKATSAIEPGGWAALSWPYPLTAEGTYVVSAECQYIRDQRPQNDFARAEMIVEVGPPRLTVTAPAEGAIVTGTVSVRGTASSGGPNLTGVEVRVDAGEWQDASDRSGSGDWSMWEWSFDTTTVPDGNHTLWCRARDQIGAETRRGVNVTVINQGNRPPNAIIDLPTPGTYNGNMQIQFLSASTDPDGDPLDHAWRSNRTGLLGYGASLTAYLPDGGHRITLTSTDPGGLSSSASVDIFVERGEGIVFLSDDMEAPGGWWHNGINDTWQWGVPSSGPGSAHSGDRLWATNLTGDYEALFADASLGSRVNLTSATGEVFLTFWHWYEIETGFDGGVVEASEDNLTWSDLPPERGYDAPVSGAYGNPLGGREAFTGRSGGWVLDRCNLTPYAGQEVFFRFRFATDGSVSDLPGWYIDDVAVGSAVANRPPHPVISSPREGTQTTEGASLILDGRESYDPDGDPFVLRWTSDLDGVLGDAPVISVELTPGEHRLTLAAEDSHGLAASAEVRVTVVPRANRPPIPVISEPAEGDEFVEGQTIRFDASGSTDPDGDPLTFEWMSSIDGALGQGEQVLRPLTPGNHQITLAASDGREVAKTHVRIFVHERPNLPPSAVISSPVEGARIVEGTPVLFDGTSSRDPEGGNLTFRWRSSLDGELGAAPSFSRVLSRGDHVVTLRTMDPWGAWSEAAVNLSVVRDIGNRQPRVEAGGDRTVWVGEEVVFEAVGVDPDDDANGNGVIDAGEVDNLTYAWDLDGDGNDDEGGARVVWTYREEGSFHVRVTATDPGGLLAVDSLMVHAIEENLPPTVDAGADQVVPKDETAILEARGVDPNDDANGNGLIDGDEIDRLSYAWDINGDGIADLQGRRVEARFDAAGVYNVTVKASDGEYTASDYLHVVVDTPPVAMGQAVPTLSRPNEEVRFISYGYDPDDDTNGNRVIDGGETDRLIHRWDFGDGVVTEGREVAHGYAAEGRYTVRLTVEDPYGLNATATLTVTVAADNRPPVAAIQGYKSLVVEQDHPVRFDGSPSRDPDGDMLSYRWDFDDTVDADGDGNKTNDAEDTNRIVTHAFRERGNFRVTLTVSDGRGGMDQACVSVQVVGRLPAEEAGNGGLMGWFRDRFGAVGGKISTGVVIAGVAALLVIAGLVLLLSGRRGSAEKEESGDGIDTLSYRSSPAKMATADAAEEGPPAARGPPRTVRCPACGGVFVAHGSGGSIDTVCPHCGAWERIVLPGAEGEPAEDDTPDVPPLANEGGEPAEDAMGADEEPEGGAEDEGAEARFLDVQCPQCRSVFEVFDTGTRPLAVECPVCASEGQIA